MRRFVVRFVDYDLPDEPPGGVVIQMLAENVDATPVSVEAGPGCEGMAEYAEEMRVAGIGVAGIASRMGQMTGLFDETDLS